MAALLGFEPRPFASEAGHLECPVLTFTLQGNKLDALLRKLIISQLRKPISPSAQLGGVGLEPTHLYQRNCCERLLVVDRGLEPAILGLRILLPDHLEESTIIKAHFVELESNQQIRFLKAMS